MSVSTSKSASGVISMDAALIRRRGRPVLRKPDVACATRRRRRGPKIRAGASAAAISTIWTPLSRFRTVCSNQSNASVTRAWMSPSGTMSSSAESGSVCGGGVGVVIG